MWKVFNDDIVVNESVDGREKISGKDKEVVSGEISIGLLTKFGSPWVIEQLSQGGSLREEVVGSWMDFL